MATIISIPDVAEGGEKALQWSAIEKLPTFDRLRTTVLTVDGKDHGSETTVQNLDVTKISVEERQHIVDRILRVTDEGNECFLRKLRGRLDRSVHSVVIDRADFQIEKCGNITHDPDV